VQSLREHHPDVLLAISTLLPDAQRRALQAQGCLVVTEPAEAVRTIAALANLGQQLRQPLDEAAAAAAPPAPSQAVPTGPLSEPQALALLGAAGLRTVPHRVVQSADEAVAAARALGYPVVMKVVSADITHKSDVGGVALGLADDDAVRAALASMQAAVARQAPQACIDGWLVAPLLRGGVECILGIQRDPVFGPMVMFGLGGVFVEIVGDVALHSAPVTPEQALQMMRSTRAWPLLNGARGRPPADVDALAQQIAALSRWAVACGDTLASVDVNPYLALPAAQGGGCALDGVVVGRPAALPT
jgi:acetate---CoA ligase (ADP-forming)